MHKTQPKYQNTRLLQPPLVKKISSPKFTLWRNSHPKHKAVATTTRTTSQKQGKREELRLSHAIARVNKLGIHCLFSSSCFQVTSWMTCLDYKTVTRGTSFSRRVFEQRSKFCMTSSSYDRSGWGFNSLYEIWCDKSGAYLLRKNA